jgi:multidrug efflux system membrane fusion protein
MDERARPVVDDVALEPLARRHELRRELGAEELEAPARPRSAWRALIFLFVLALAAFGLYRLVTSAPVPQESNAERLASRPQPVSTATVKKGTIRIIVNALGTVTPIATTTVKPQVSGQLLEVNFVEGQIVKKGDVLAQIDPRPFQLAEQQYQGQLLRDQGLLEQARVNLARYQTLLKQNSIARQQVEDQSFLVQQYEGAIRADQALIDQQRLNQTYARITAPISGRIGLRLVDVGNYVTSDTGIAVITQIDPISVIFTVPEDELSLILAETRAGKTLEVAAYDRANLHKLAVGKVAAIDNQIDTTTGTVKIRAEFKNADDQLFPNRFVTARLIVKTLDNAVTIAVTAVQRGAPGTYVYVVNADNTVSVRPIEIGPTDEGQVAVMSGLSPGERVVTEGADRLREGAKVLIPDEEPAAAETAAAPSPSKAAAPAPHKKAETPGPAPRPRPDGAANAPAHK